MPTGLAVSPDSGEHWSEPGAYRVAEGVHRIPLPLPMDGLKAVNVYVIETPGGLTMIDGGWAITEGREALEAGFKQLGFVFGDIDRILVTHVHRDHYSLASVIGQNFGAKVALGIGDKPTLDLLINGDEFGTSTRAQLFEAGAIEIAKQWGVGGWTGPQEEQDIAFPDEWLDNDPAITLGARTLNAVHTPGHTQGHFVFADYSEGLLFAGDHVLPTITPSIGFEPVPVQQPLRDFMTSLTRVRALPDLRLLPAHGPVWMSSHERIDQLLAHHEQRLELCLDSLSEGPKTAVQVAHDLPWTRHAHKYETLDIFNSALAAMETKAHLELLVARGQATRTPSERGVIFALV